MSLTHEALLFSPTREGVPSSDDNFTADDLIAAQDALEAEARDALPFSFAQCTYDLGYLKQPLFACRTCLNDSAVCAACSISCHGEHELVELFNRRHFRCDCGSQRMGAGSCCGLTGRKDAPVNEDNRYDKNFQGKFCFCGRPYDPQTETDTMYQCLVCEDWLHHECLLGAHAESNSTPLSQEDFDEVVCSQCVKRNRDGVRTLLNKYAGREGTGVLLVTGTDGKTVLGRMKEEQDVESEQSELQTIDKDKSPKRKSADELDSDANEPAPKKLKLEPASGVQQAAALQSVPETGSNSAGCTAPAPLPPGESPLERLDAAGGKVNVYLQDGFTEQWCRCKNCLPLFVQLPYILDEEEVYEPPEDPDAHKSTFELGMDALNRMPRAQAIEGALAYQGLSQRLKDFLRPVSESGETVTRELIQEFFEREKADLAERMRAN